MSFVRPSVRPVSRPLVVSRGSPARSGIREYSRLIIRLDSVIYVRICMRNIRRNSRAFLPYFSPPGASYPSNSVSAVYDAFHRVVFALATALLIMMCHAGKGGIVNMLLSWPGFIPVGKLWLLIYLVHPFVIFHSNGTLRAPVYYTKKQLVSDLFFRLYGSFPQIPSGIRV